MTLTNSPHLRVLRGDLGDSSIPLTQSPLRLGRDPAQNDLVLPAHDPRLSRQHCELVEEFGRWVLIDHSRNGVVVNDEVVKQARRELSHGDRLLIGDSVELLFEDPNSTFAVGDVPPKRLYRGLRFDPARLTVWRDGVALNVHWSPQELALVRYLFERPGQVCAYAELLAVVWGKDSALYGREHVQELAARVRRKLEPDLAHPRYLLTKPGQGYVLVMSPE